MERFTETDCSKCGVPVNVDLDPQGDLVRYADAQCALDAEREKVNSVTQRAEYAEGRVQALLKEGDKRDAQLATLQAQLRQVEEERNDAKGNYYRACMTIASMHSAAVGTVGNGPKRGVVEDVEDLRTAYTTLRQLVEDVLHTFDYLRFHRVAGMDGLLYETHNTMSPDRTVEACEKRIRATLAREGVK